MLKIAGSVLAVMAALGFGNSLAAHLEDSAADARSEIYRAIHKKKEEKRKKKAIKMSYMMYLYDTDAKTLILSGCSPKLTVKFDGNDGKIDGKSCRQGSGARFIPRHPDSAFLFLVRRQMTAAHPMPRQHVLCNLHNTR